MPRWYETSWAVVAKLDLLLQNEGVRIGSWILMRLLSPAAVSVGRVAIWTDMFYGQRERMSAP